MSRRSVSYDGVSLSGVKVGLLYGFGRFLLLFDRVCLFISLYAATMGIEITGTELNNTHTANTQSEYGFSSISGKFTCVRTHIKYLVMTNSPQRNVKHHVCDSTSFLEFQNYSLG